MPKKIQFALLNMHLLAAYIIITPPPVLSMQFIDTNIIRDASNDCICSVIKLNVATQSRLVLPCGTDAPVSINVG